MFHPEDLPTYYPLNSFSKSLLRGWGDLIYVFILIPIAKLYNFESIILLFIGILSASIVCLSANIIIMTFAFWFNSWSNLAQKYYMTLLIFCSYPTNIYSGFMSFNYGNSCKTG